VFAGADFERALRPEQFVGRAPQQVDEFLAAEIDPLRQRYPAALFEQTAQISR
jgi:adenylosuccinate lyase